MRAYRNAARTVESFGRDIAGLLKRGQALPKLPGIGEDLAGKIGEIARTGRSTQLERLHRDVPAAITSLLTISGLGPKRVGLLFHELGIESPEQLRAAAEQGHLRQLRGFGAKTERKLLETLHARQSWQKRFPIGAVADAAEALADDLRRVKGVSQVTIAGSYRRLRDTVGDLDLLVSARDADAVMQRLVHHEDVQEILSQGPTRTSVVLRSSLQVDLRVLEKASFGAGLVYFTGSKAHNIAIRRLAQRRKLKISEYGVYRGEKRIAGETEASVYRALGLSPVPPELRENRGEIEAARTGRLPKLVEAGDLKGDLHAHTKASDGRASLEEMAKAAMKLGLHYLAITEHSKSLAIAQGLDEKRLLEQLAQIDRLNAKLSGITLLKGIEVDIHEDGRLDLPDTVLSGLDIVVGAVHSHFDLPRRKQTRRLLRAMESRYFTLLAHPNAREIDRREPIQLDMEAVIKAAKERGCFLELNAQPKRLDLWDLHCRQAKEAGVLVSLNTDAHSTLDLVNRRFGVGQARRGWLEKEDVLNTRPLHELRKRIGACFA